MGRWALLLVGLLVLGGCGGDSKQARTPPAPRHSATPAGRDPKPAAEADAKVIRGWADALRGGHVARAARFFALPALVSNNTPLYRLRTRREVELFNRALPCGARVTRTQDTGAFLVASFEFTERPGAGRCGQGVGGTGAVAFLIRGGKIAQWRRVLDEPEDAGPSGTPS